MSAPIRRIGASNNGNENEPASSLLRQEGAFVAANTVVEQRQRKHMDEQKRWLNGDYSLLGKVYDAPSVLDLLQEIAPFSRSVHRWAARLDLLKACMCPCVLLSRIEALLSGPTSHEMSIHGPALPLSAGLPLHWPMCVASVIFLPLLPCIHGWQRSRASWQYGFADDDCGPVPIAGLTSPPWVMGTVCCCFSAAQLLHFLSQREQEGNLRWSWESPHGSWDLSARPRASLLPTKVLVLGTNSVDHLCLVQVLVGRTSASRLVSHTEPSTPLSISTVAVPMDGRLVPAAVEFWDVPWDLNLVTVGPEFLFDGVSVVLLAYNPLEPRTLVEAATRFWELCPLDQAAKCTCIPVMVIPDSYDGAKRRSVLAKIGKGLFNAVLSRAKLQLPFEGTDINLQNRAGCTKLLRRITAIGEEATGADNGTSIDHEGGSVDNDTSSIDLESNNSTNKDASDKFDNLGDMWSDSDQESQ